MRVSSLATRLLLVTTAWAVTVLLITGIVLLSLYRDAVERAFDARLHVYLKSIVAGVASAPEDSDFNPGNFGEPRFDLPLSGWYWQIRPVGERKGDTVASPSLFDQTLPLLADLGIAEGRGFTRDAYVRGPGGQRLRMVERRIDFGFGATYVMAVAGDAGEIEADIANFQSTLAIALAVLGIGVIASTVLQVRWALAPLSRISRALAAIRSGEAHRLEGEVPREIKPLADEINALIHANQDVVERARTHVGNLAHALKTPLSVITNEARGHDDPFSRKVAEQADVMRDQVQHHLERARAAARISVTTETTDVGEVLTGLARAMERIYRDRSLSLSVLVAPGLRFRGERQDLEEMCGNLLDNACKWAATGVSVEAIADPDGANGPRLRVVVDDDGPGMAPDKREAAMRRGQRLDETKPGSGLGLAIISDLAALYGGSFALAAAPRGGLRAELALPAV